MKLKNIVAGAALALLSATSCSSPENIAYMQNARSGQEQTILNACEIKVQPLDQLTIVVSCKEPELAALFNLVEANKRLSAGGNGAATNSAGNVSAYTVDGEGNIDFPILGKVHIAGLTRQQICEKVQRLLIDGNWVADPVVTVEFANLRFSVLGEVGSPGTYPITNDRMTLLEAISKAGDLTVHGQRNIMVVREQGSQRRTYRVDLRSDELFNSPVYYLQQNDVIYVEPDKALARQAADNPNNLKSISLWTGMATFLMSIAVLIAK